MADEKPKVHVIIVDPDKVVYEGDATRVFAPGKIAELALLPEHTPLYSELTAGPVIIEEVTGTKQEFKIDGGVAKMQNNELHILIGY
jgi:F-type H+-transporting ATPase subunit epsilon